MRLPIQHHVAVRAGDNEFGTFTDAPNSVRPNVGNARSLTYVVTSKA